MLLLSSSSLPLLLGSGNVRVFLVSWLDDLLSEAGPLVIVVRDGSWSNGLASDGGLLGGEFGEVLFVGLAVVLFFFSDGSRGSITGSSGSSWSRSIPGRSVGTVGLGLVSLGISYGIFFGLELSVTVFTTPSLLDGLFRVDSVGSRVSV